jgi:DNA-binding transcriptional LysR family regulator
VELRDLRAYAATVEAGAVTRAAQQLHLVQSAVSQAVKRLERELGVVLLERRPDGVRPTEAGALFADHARLIVNAADHARRDMNAFRELARGSVRVGIVYAAVPAVLAPLLRAAADEQPGVELEFEEGLATALASRIRLGYLDLGIFFLPLDEHGLEVTELASLELGLLVPRGHRLARRRRVAMRDVPAETWVTFPPGNPGRAWLDETFEAASAAPGALVEVQTLGAVKAFVEAGRGLALLPRGAVQEDGSGVAFVPLAPAYRATLVAAAKVGEPSPAVHAVRELVQATIAGLA